ncbi:MAG: tetratricopeptide repeat protein [Verrucomicrobiota bacterium]
MRLCAGEPPGGSTKVWKQHRAQAETALATGNLDDALNHFEKALAEAEKLGKRGQDEVLQSLQDLGLYHLHARWSPAHAALLLQRALSVAKGAYRSPSSEVAVLHLHLAKVHLHMAHMKEAQAHLDQARAILLQKYKSPGKRLAPYDYLQAEIDAAQRRYAEAERAYESVLKSTKPSVPLWPLWKRVSQPVGDPSAIIGRTQLPAYHGAAACLYGLVEVRTSMDKIPAAEADFRRLLNLLEKNLTLPSATISAVKAFAEWNYWQGKFPEAEAQTRRAIDLLEKFFGPDAKASENMYMALAHICQMQGKTEEADQHLSHALAVARIRLVPMPEPGGNTLLEWAKLEALSDRRSAERLVSEALAIKQAALASDDPELADFLQAQGLFHLEMGRTIDGARALYHALAIRETALGPNHPTAADLLETLAGLHLAAKENTQAETLLRRAVAARGKEQIVNYEKLALSLNRLIGIYKLTGQQANLPPLYEHLIHTREKQHGQEHIEIAQSVEQLVDLYLSEDKFAEAELWCERMLGIEERQRGAKNFVLLAPLGKLATVYRKLGKDVELAGVLKKQLSLIEDTFGAKHKALLTSLDEYAQVMRRLQRDPEATEAEARAKAIRAAEGQ